MAKLNKAVAEGLADAVASGALSLGTFSNAQGCDADIWFRSYLRCAMVGAIDAAVDEARQSSDMSDAQARETAAQIFAVFREVASVRPRRAKRRAA